jgi:prepilin-type processing-associated H-X9-DG protein/prepilin-type N-terminal cleavage/methylation domain-containing protein
MKHHSQMKTQSSKQICHRRLTPAANSISPAFTLLELLVAIAVMAILFALVVSGLSRARMSARRVACISNLKQWGYAAHVYASEHEDKLPREAAIDGINSWQITALPTSEDVWYNALATTAGILTMAQYAQTPSSQQDFYLAGKIFHCPSARFSDVSATYPNFSLAINSKLMRDFERSEPSPSVGVSEGCKLSTIKVPDSTALFLDNGIPGEEKLCEFQPMYTGQPKACASEFPGRHNRGGNIAFADGHVQTVPGKDVVEMDPASVYCGRAIYPPREVIWCPNPAAVP